MPATAWTRWASASCGRTRVGSTCASRPISSSRFCRCRAARRSPSEPARRGPIDLSASISCSYPTFPPRLRIGSAMPCPVNQGVYPVTSPAAGVDFDRNRLSQGELIAGIAGIVLLIDLWFKWYSVSAKGFGITVGASANAWDAFGGIDIILFLVALTAIGVAVLRALDRLPEMPFPPATLLTVAGGIALLLILFRTIDTPVDTHGVKGIDVSRGFGLWLGLLSAAALTYGGWRAMQESGASFGDLGGGGGGAGATAPTTPMAPTPTDDLPGKEGPGVPNPGTSTGAPGDKGGGPPPAASAGDPVPGQTAGETPPGLAGEPPAGEGTHP